MTNSDYLNLFQATVKVNGLVGGTEGQNYKLTEEEISNIGANYDKANYNNKIIMYVGEVKSAK